MNPQEQVLRQTLETGAFTTNFLVEAGAGAGKSHTICQRILHQLVCRRRQCDHRRTYYSQRGCEPDTDGRFESDSRIHHRGSGQQHLDIRSVGRYREADLGERQHRRSPWRWLRPQLWRYNDTWRGHKSNIDQLWSWYRRRQRWHGNRDCL